MFRRNKFSEKTAAQGRTKRIRRIQPENQTKSSLGTRNPLGANYLGELHVGHASYKSDTVLAGY